MAKWGWLVKLAEHAPSIVQIVKAIRGGKK